MPRIDTSTLARRLAGAALACAALSFFVPANVSAQPIPQAVVDRIPVGQSGSLNLGYTSFMDGFGSNEPGWVYQGFLRYQRADSVKDSGGDTAAVPANPRIDITAWANQFIYTSAARVGDGNLGVTLIVPFLNTRASSDPLPPPAPPGATLSDNGAGLGDAVAGAFVQFRPTVDGRGRPVFVHRLELDLILSTGKYDGNRDVQPGSHFWSINPYWAITALPSPNWELSARLQYVYNFRNSAPANVPPVVTSTQAGQAAFANFAASYEIVPRLRVGLNGYYLRQVSDSRVNDIRQTDARAQKLALGPGVVWAFSKADRLFANYYIESVVKNAPKFKAGQLRWVHEFE